jgi:site-specific DNA-methyltransferase (adenine-specific)
MKNEIKMELNKIYNCDCMDYMSKVPDKFFDLAIVDPPYGIKVGIDGIVGIDKKAQCKKYKPVKWDNHIPNKKYFSELHRISKDQIIWGANYFGLIGGYIFWNKKQTMKTYSAGELAYCSKIKSVKYYEFRWNGMLQENMKNKEKRIHPTQKPIALYRWLLQNYAKQNDKIFDSHMGSGSSVIACIEEKFEYVACEKDFDYYNDAVNRIEEFKSQGRLF